MDEKRDWYPRANQIWTVVITVQVTLWLSGLVLDDARLLKASLIAGLGALGVGIPVMNEYFKRKQAAKEAEEASKQ